MLAIKTLNISHLMKANQTKKRAAKKRLALRDIFTFNGSIRIPVYGSVPLFKEAKLIVETSVFQRLRGVRQLGPTHFVFPGAIHTRFEHSLGTYALSLKYVESLLAQDEFYNFQESPIEMARLLIASSLLHDIGHYPFSHLIEEIGRFVDLKGHEDRAEEIIKSSEVHTILQEQWKIDPKIVCDAIRGRALTGGFAVMASALSGVLDLDKMDYLIRDSIHCGVNFGMALDYERFLTGLKIDKINATICVSTKAESHIPTLIAVRNLMYNEVYWHKTVRACSSMFKALFYSLYARNILKKNELESLLFSQDDRVAFRLNVLAKKSKSDSLMSLAAPFVFESRALYKMVYVFGMSVANGKPNAKSFFSGMLKDDHLSIENCLSKANILRKTLSRLCTTLQDGDILVENTPIKPGHEMFSLENMRLVNERTGEFEKPTYDLSAVDGLLNNTRKVFIFCHPARFLDLHELKILDWERVFYEAQMEEA